MYDQILFPTDGSETARAAFDYALDVAAAHDATIRVINVADTTQTSATRISGDVVDVLEREGTDIVDDAARRAGDRDVSVLTDVYQGQPAETIVEYADTYDVDLILMATHGRSGLRRYLLGSVTEKVVRTATTPVLTVTPSEQDELTYPCGDLLLPTDGSRSAGLALTAAIELATATDARLHLLSVVETANLGIDVRSSMHTDRLDDRANDILDAASERARTAGVDDVVTAIEAGRPYREIRSYVDGNDIDLTILGTRGETDFSQYALGGVSAKLLRTSPVPVMLVRDVEAGN